MSWSTAADVRLATLLQPCSRHSGGDRLSDDRLLTYLASRYSVRLSTVGAAGGAGAASAAASGSPAAARRSAGSSGGGGSGGSGGASGSGEPWPALVGRGGSGVDTNPWEIDFSELEIIQVGVCRRGGRAGSGPIWECSRLAAVPDGGFPCGLATPSAPLLSFRVLQAVGEGSFGKVSCWHSGAGAREMGSPS